MGCGSVAYGFTAYGFTACRSTAYGYVGYGYMVYGYMGYRSIDPISISLGNGVVAWILNGCYSWNGVIWTVRFYNIL